MVESLDRQLIANSTVVLIDSYAKVPRIEGSITPLNFDGPSAKLFSSCKEKRARRRGQINEVSSVFITVLPMEQINYIPEV